MTIKIIRDESCCEPVFEPYTLTLHVDNPDDHRALKYLSMCNSKVPDALYEKASKSLSTSRYRDHAGSIRSRTKAFLLELGTKMPVRNQN